MTPLAKKKHLPSSNKPPFRTKTIAETKTWWAQSNKTPTKISKYRKPEEDSTKSYKILKIFNQRKNKAWPTYKYSPRLRDHASAATPLSQVTERGRKTVWLENLYSGGGPTGLQPPASFPCLIDPQITHNRAEFSPPRHPASLLCFTEHLVDCMK